MKSHLEQPGRHAPALGFGAVLAACLWLGPETVGANPGSWAKRANLPAARVGAAGAAIDGILYVAGGATTAPYGAATHALFAYDPAADAWKRKADLPTARVLGAAAAADGKLYVIGGVAEVAEATVLATVEAYDPKTDTWATKTSMPTARGDVAACTLDGRIYVVGGWVLGTFLSTVECYDPKTDQWTPKSDLPVTAEIPVVQAVNGRLYAFTGNRTLAYDPGTDQWTPRADLPDDSLRAVASAVGTVDGRIYLFGGFARPSDCGSAAALVYDPVQDQYTGVSVMPTPTAVAVSVAIGGKIYVAGGTSGVGTECAGSGIGYATLRIYDPNGADQPSGSWTRKADLPEARVAAAAGQVDGVFYVAGGNTAPLLPTQPKTLFAYDPKTDVWSRRADLPTGRELAAAAVAGGLLYVIGGITGYDPVTVVDTVEAYDPKTDQWTKKASMPTARGDVAGCTLGGQIYVIGGAVPGVFLSTVESYDPQTDRWTTKASLPVTAEVPVAQVAQGRLHVFADNRSFVYDADLDRWTATANLPVGSLQVRVTASGAIDGQVFLFGGLLRPSMCASAKMLAYDPVADQFAQKPTLPTPMFGTASAVIDGKVYLAGGASGYAPDCSGAVVHRRLWVYDPQGREAPAILGFVLDDRTTWRLAWQAEAGREYGVDTAPLLGERPWEPLTLPTGLTIVASNSVVEVRGQLAPNEQARFFRVRRVN